LTVPPYCAAVTEDDFLRTLSLAGRLRIAAVDLAATGAPRALVEDKLGASLLQVSRMAGLTTSRLLHR
jgi:hypothetical protein